MNNLRVLIIVALVALIGRGISVTNAQEATPAATSSASLQAQIDANNQQINDLNQQIATYQAQLTQIGADKKTLQQAISALDIERSKVQAQVNATERQINVTQLQIEQLGSEIVDASQTIAVDQIAVGEDLLALQKAGNQPLFMQILSSTNLADAWSGVNATLQVQDAIQNKMQALQTQEGSLVNSQAASKQKQITLTSQKQSLASQQQSLAATEQSKSQLLTETNAKESNYEKLLAQAEAELQSFSTFAQNAGGSKLVSNQTACDAWGCYYNQRDALWGNDLLDGTKFTLASDGCLVTAMAMVLTHYGYRDVTPVTININPDNFAVYYPAYLLTSINVDGVTATRKAATIDATLATGNPVIVGLNAYGGTHYVVLVSGSKGNYLMRDPYITDGNSILFADHYSLRHVFAVSKVVIGS
jgi:peptidoglycan hydrolase CwlO-like protein